MIEYCWKTESVQVVNKCIDWFEMQSRSSISKFHANHETTQLYTDLSGFYLIITWDVTLKVHLGWYFADSKPGKIL